MCTTDRKWTVYLLQHSHTDIGYTDSQEEITKDHVSFIREVLKEAEDRPQSGFKWVCETLWGVEQFLAAATEKEKADFVRAVRSGKVGLSASYLNMTEAVQGDVIRYRTESALNNLRAMGLEAHYALTSDVNGYAWGYADILADIGVRGLLCQLNSTHGREPFDRRQTPFIWESPRGQKVLVWIGEHYNLGNRAGLEPFLEHTLKESMQTAEEQLPAYLNQLAKQGYPYDFCPMGISGVFTDNAPPNPAVADLVDEWNKKNGSSIEVHMATLEDFFAREETIAAKLPVVRGDWTDWWADGVGSTPAPLKTFRQAQRMYDAIRRLDPERRTVTEKEEDALTYNLMMYAEHTWGSNAAVSSPWAGRVSELDEKKALYATEAHVQAKDILDKLLIPYGKARKTRGHFRHFGVLNPLDHAVKVPLQWPVTYPLHFPQANVLVGQDGKRFPAERTDPFLWSLVEIPAGTNYVLHAETEDQPPREALLVREGPLYRTDRYALRIEPEAGGIIRWTDLEQKRDLTDLYREDAILRPVYERTDAPQNGLEQCSLRRSFCRSRRNAETKQYPARLQQVSILRNSPERAVLRLEYEAEGCKFLFEDLTFYRGMSRVDVNLILLKKSEWDPESLYLSLPFTAKTGTVFVDKTDSIIRPGIDQLPRACSNFFLTQNGMVFTDGEGRFTSVYCADTPLIWMGRLDHLQPDEANGTAEQNRRPAYAWIMNNVWETNFKVMLAGFYKFGFTVRTGEGEADMAFAQMREESCLPLPYLHTDLAN